MGLLASGAAHELGTPLASLSVILSDWRRMPALSSDPEMTEDMVEMQAALQRCKSIVTGILVSAGEARGEGIVRDDGEQFPGRACRRDERAARSVSTLSYENKVRHRILRSSLTTALKQVVFNVLDNAFEVSPSWVEFAAERAMPTRLCSTSADNGPGFDAEMLANLGKPINQAKGVRAGALDCSS